MFCKGQRGWENKLVNKSLKVWDIGGIENENSIERLKVNFVVVKKYCEEKKKIKVWKHGQSYCGGYSNLVHYEYHDCMKASECAWGVNKIQ